MKLPRTACFVPVYRVSLHCNRLGFPTPAKAGSLRRDGRITTWNASDFFETGDWGCDEVMETRKGALMTDPKPVADTHPLSPDFVRHPAGPAITAMDVTLTTLTVTWGDGLSGAFNRF